VIPRRELVLWLEAEVPGLELIPAWVCSGNGEDLCSVGVTVRIVDLSALPSDRTELGLLCAVLGRRRDTGRWSLLVLVRHSLLALE
jgi:hypothetical protein